MRLYSNKGSIARGEVSILAVIETLLAMTLVFYLSAHLNTLRWLAVAMCVSPLLLLRTEESTRLAIKGWDWWDNKPSAAHPLVDYLMFPLVAFAVRIGATLAVLVSSPISALRAIPTNWSRVTLAMDSSFEPEIVPDHPTANLRSVLRDLTGSVRIFAFVVALPLFLPALVYRWSLKATSVIYAPFIFVVHSTFNERTDLRTKLELIKRSDLSRIRAFYGVIAISAFLLKLVLMMKWNGFVDWWMGNPITQFLALYIAPAEIPKWQLAEIANSVLAVGTIFFSRHALLRYELNDPFPEKPVKRILGFVSGLRWVLALYTILCAGYITMREALQWHWPALGTKWVPW